MASIDHLTSLEKDIMDFAVDDIFGLHEVIWRLNTLHPERADTAGQLEIAMELVTRLVSSGWLDVYWWNGRTNELAPVTLNVARQLLSDRENWQPANADERVVVFASKTGQAPFHGASA